MLRYLPLMVFGGLCALLLSALLKPAENPRDEQWPIGQTVPQVMLPLLPKDPLGPTIASMPLGFALAGAKQTHGYVLNFFASWCAPCIVEMPLLTELAKTHGVALVGVAWKDQPQALATFLNKHGRPFTQILLDQDGKAMTEIGATGVPETFVVDGNGVIRKRYAGNLTKDTIMEIVDFLQSPAAAAKPIAAEQ